MSEIFTLEKQGRIGDDRPTLVLDTNTVLALWMFRDPTLDALREWIEAGNCRLHSREDALEELRHVLAYRQFGLSETAQAHILTAYRDRTVSIADIPALSTAPPALPRCQDADDQKFLEIAQSSGASHLLTRDKLLLRLRRHTAICRYCQVETPEDFQSQLAKTGGAKHLRT